MKLASLPTGQAVLPWYLDHVAALAKAKAAAAAKRRDDIARLRRERSGIRYLLTLADLPETHLSREEIEKLDEYVQYKMNEIKRSWTPEREAEARGVHFRNKDRWFISDGRIFQQGQGVPFVGSDEWGDAGDGDYE